MTPLYYSILKDCLEARKNSQKIKALLLTTLIADIQKRAKDAQRVVSDDDVVKAVKYFIKNNIASQESRLDPKLQAELEILQSIPMPEAPVFDLVAIVNKLIEENPEKIQALKDKSQAAVGWFIGQAKKETSGAADAVEVMKLINAAVG